MKDGSLQNEFECALEAILARILSVNESQTQPSIAVGYSGGVDSTVLLHLLCHFAQKKGCRIVAFHVHHGLNPKADAWLSHCQQTCQALQVPFEAAHVHLQAGTGESVETQARRLRYAALGDLCRKHGVRLLLSAHHADDQIETILMQYMRGTGLAGLSGMESTSQLPQLLGEGIVLGRPLLAFTKQQLQTCQRVNAWTHIEDDSNEDVQYTRNAVRHQLMPLLQTMFPGYGERMQRTARHVQEAQSILDEVAQKDLAIAEATSTTFNLKSIAGLSLARQNNVLRFWFKAHQIPIISTAWFDEACEQLFHARIDAQIELPLSDGRVLRRYRGQIILDEAIVSTQEQTPVRIDWHGEHRIRLYQWGGDLIFEPAEVGFESQWLMDRPLMVMPYDAQAEIKLSRRPTKKLKILCQENAIAAWQRNMLPLVFRDDVLIYVGGIGAHADFEQSEGRCFTLKWQPFSV